jgi:5-formyltetrahydrofolate cyclo-ligase
MTNIERWKGRNSKKDQLRRTVWGALEESGAAIGSPWSTIPNFNNAKQAANQLTQLDAWQSANVVKSNPDSAQAWVRLNALKQGKRVYTPVPELVNDFPFILLDPEKLKADNIAFEDVMYSDGAMKQGQRVNFDQIEPLDFVVVGCVAVTASGGRTGKGAGFADLELGLFRHYGCVSASTPIVTTVHDIQVVDDSEIVMESHDTPLDWIATPEKLIKSTAAFHEPGEIEWDKIQDDQYKNIPFLLHLRQEIAGY